MPQSQQSYLPDLEPPPDPADHPEIAPLIDALLIAEADHKRAGEVKAIRRDILMSKMAELGVPKVKYPDPKNGKPMWMKLDDAKRLKREKVREGKRAKSDAEHEQEERESKESDTGREQWEAEVKRRRAEQATDDANVEDMRRERSASADPFASTRAALDPPSLDAIKERYTSDDDETPAQQAVREAEEARASRRNKRR